MPIRRVVSFCRSICRSLSVSLLTLSLLAAHVSAQPCPIACQPSDILENEPNCGQPTDTVNAGCTEPPLVTPIACGQTVCGTSVFNTDTFAFDNDTYRIILTQSRRVTFTLNSEFAADMYFFIGSCPEGDLLDFVPAGDSCTPTTLTRCLPVGKYFLHVLPNLQSPISVPCGSHYRLSAACDPCSLAPNITCDDAQNLSIPSSTTASTQDGFFNQGLPVCGISAASTPGLWYHVTGNGHTLTASTCNAVTDFDTALSVYCGSCDALFCVASNNNDACPGSQLKAKISWCAATGQDYYVLVYGGFGQNIGTFRLDLTDSGTSCTPTSACAPCMDPCPPESRDENEPTCGLSPIGQPDPTVNGGCSTTPPAFSPIQCDLPICGTAAFNGVFRDEDLYILPITGSQIITAYVTADFEAEVVIWAAAPACPSIYPVVTGFATRCLPFTLRTPCVPENTYYIMVAPRFTDPVACGTRYTLTVHCEPCTICPVTAPGAICPVQENCAPVTCGDRVCATMVYPGNIADLDCYVLALDTPQRIDWRVTAPFRHQLEIDQLMPDQSFETRALAIGQACEPIDCVACLDAGTYFFIMVNDFGQPPFPHGLPYQFDVICGPCTPSAACTAAAIPENEPDCGLPFDTTDGGCASFPDPLFRDIVCGTEVCGTCGTDSETQVRDTDWYQLVLTEGGPVTWTVNAQFPAQIGILETDGVPVCPTLAMLPMSLALSQTPISVSACLHPGTWWFFVGPTVGPVTCGTSYSAKLTCGCPCPGDADRNGHVDGRDVSAFTECLLSSFDGCAQCPCADMNGDHAISPADIGPFVARVLSGSCN